MEHRHTALKLAYDGAGFRGWQRQPGLATVQEAVERALSAVLGADVLVHGAARTDAGVAAEGQVAHFKRRVAAALAPAELAERLPAALPAGVRLVEAAAAHPSFHARSSAIGKRYRYRFAWGPAPVRADSPGDAGGFFQLGAQAQPRWEMARRALDGLAGLPAITGLASPSPDRRPAPPLLAWSLLDQAGLAVLEVRAAAFRKHQVRNLAGHLAAIALGLAEPETLAALAVRARPWMGATAPPHGLCLVEVEYPPQLDPFRPR